MSLKFHNTLGRSLQDFSPLEADHVRMYTCGPTVYNYAHIGNYRAYIFEDLLRRYLKYCGYRVTQVMNLTDVDDKTIKGSRAEGVSLDDFTAKYKQAFFEDIDTLNIERAEHYPAATGHVAEMIALIEALFEKGCAYQSPDGSVYFKIAACPDYGRLAQLDLAGLRAGERVAQDEYDKENAADFALWKAWDEEDGDVVWDSPWGRGRPGWHIECSAMSMKYLGESFDIHTGGIDNIFPHHVDEIAQSECATGQPYAHTWLHCAHLIVDGKKMSKSLGNFHTLREILAKGYSGRELRYELLATHYRQTLNFSFAGLDAARAALERIDAFRERIAGLAGDSAGALPSWASETEHDFAAALDDDLNISGALAALFDLIHAGNRECDADTLESGAAAAVLGLLERLDSVFGFIAAPAEQLDPELERMAQEREAARRDKNWAEADRLRDELLARGYRVEDTPQGPRLKAIKSK
jgi:cysteinyl-tRNA synthetase